MANKGNAFNTIHEPPLRSGAKNDSHATHTAINNTKLMTHSMRACCMRAFKAKATSLLIDHLHQLCRFGSDKSAHLHPCFIQHNDGHCQHDL